jgi:hypothetical protein
MKNGKLWLALLLIILVATAALQFRPIQALVAEAHKRGCHAIDGKWASVENRCVTRSCYGRRDCGHWAYPSERCSRLHIGDAVGEVTFQLGEPDGEDGGKLWWWAAKAAESRIVAQIEEGRLKTLSCL